MTKYNSIDCDQNLLIMSKQKSLKFSKNIQVIQKQLQISFNFFLQGYTSSVSSVAVTSDNKYIVSGSWDNKVRIWNLLEKNKILFCKDILIPSEL